MEITKELLEQRIQSLSQDAQDVKTQFQQIQGAITYCLQLIADLEVSVLEEEDLEIVEDEDEAEMINVDPNGRKIEDVAKGVPVDET